MKYDLSKYLANATATGKKLNELQAQYSEYPLILYALDEVAAEFSKKNASDKIDVPDLTPQQLEFIASIDSGEPWELRSICDTLGIRKSEIIIWIKTNRLFSICYEIIKQADAE